MRRAQVDAVPMRFALVDGWLYLTANAPLGAAIGHNAWVAVAIAAHDEILPRGSRAAEDN